MDKQQLTFKDILKQDPLGLLKDVKPTVSSGASEEERLIASFEEINAFYEKHHRPPNQKSIQESSLFYRLKGMRNNPDKLDKLLVFDRYDLLKPTVDKSYDLSLKQPKIAAEPVPEPLETSPPPSKVAVSYTHLTLPTIYSV